MVNETTKQYIENLNNLKSDNEKLSLFKNKCIKDNIPIITDDVAAFIKVLISASNVKSVLEIGTAYGYSAALFAEAIGSDAKIKTIERYDKHYNEAVQNTEKLGLKNNIEIVNADASEELENEKSSSFDMIFLDGNKGHYIHMLEDCKRILKPGGILVCDNVLFRGMVDESEPLIRRKITIVKRLRVFLKEISKDPELITTTLPIGDGLSISVKR